MEPMGMICWYFVHELASVYHKVHDFTHQQYPQSFATEMSLPHTLSSEKSNNQMQITHHHQLGSTHLANDQPLAAESKF